MPALKETRLRGRTWVNRRRPINGMSNGVTVSTDGMGLITVSGEVADGEASVSVSDAERFPVTPGATMTPASSRRTSTSS